MGGTIVCGVGGTPADTGAAELARALSARLGLRLVLVSVVDVPAGTHESLTARQRQAGAEQMLAGLAGEATQPTETRVTFGDRAEALAQVAAEEGADLIIVGSRAAGLGNQKLRSGLARELDAVSPVPVLVAPPSARKPSEHRLSVAAGAA
jgi:nucleotide-binding universal stress UspA family protein